eukprot:1152105-Pelagomonas_calceolata.AAC.2
MIAVSGVGYIGSKEPRVPSTARSETEIANGDLEDSTSSGNKFVGILNRMGMNSIKYLKYFSKLDGTGLHAAVVPRPTDAEALGPHKT